MPWHQGRDFGLGAPPRASCMLSRSQYTIAGYLGCHLPLVCRKARCTVPLRYAGKGMWVCN